MIDKIKTTIVNFKNIPVAQYHALKLYALNHGISTREAFLLAIQALVKEK